MTDTFNFPLQIGSGGSTDFKTLDAGFGDGYTQSTPDGIDNMSDSYSCTFWGKDDESTLAVTDFLDAHKGSVSFFWTPPLKPQGRFRCKGYKTTPQGANQYSVSFTLTRYNMP